MEEVPSGGARGRAERAAERVLREIFSGIAHRRRAAEIGYPERWIRGVSSAV